MAAAAAAAAAAVAAVVAAVVVEAAVAAAEAAAIVVAMVTVAPLVIANIGASGMLIAASPVLESRLRKGIPGRARSGKQAQLMLTTMTFLIPMRLTGSDQDSLLMRLSMA